MIAAAQEIIDSCTCLFGSLICFRVSVFVFNSTPEPLNKDVVAGSTAVIHADPGTGVQKELRILRTRKMAALIAVHDPRCGYLQCLPAGIEDKIDRHCVIRFPVEDVSGKPVDDGDKVKPVRPDRDIGDIDRPDVVRVIDIQTFQQIWIHFMPGFQLARVPARINCPDHHLPHMVLDRLVVDMDLILIIQSPADPAIAIPGVGSIDFINVQLDDQVIFRRRRRSVIQAGSVQTGKSGLYRNQEDPLHPCQRAAASQRQTAQRPDFFEPLVLSGSPVNLSIKLIDLRFLILLGFALFGRIVLKQSVHLGFSQALPSGAHIGGNVILGSNFIDGSFSPDRLQNEPCITQSPGKSGHMF